MKLIVAVILILGLLFAGLFFYKIPVMTKRLLDPKFSDSGEWLLADLCTERDGNYFFVLRNNNTTSSSGLEKISLEIKLTNRTGNIKIFSSDKLTLKYTNWISGGESITDVAIYESSIFGDRFSTLYDKGWEKINLEFINDNMDDWSLYIVWSGYK